MAITTRMWQGVCEAIGRAEWAQDPRFATGALRRENAAPRPSLFCALGPRRAMTGLPPSSGGDLYFRRICSHPLDAEQQKRKLVALEAMHDLRPFDLRDGNGDAVGGRAAREAASASRIGATTTSAAPPAQTSCSSPPAKTPPACTPS